MLKALELFGFKSFADRTRFDFAPGITGVVGPNGSGKSNVVDSIKWIMGDQSPKSLRGKEMTDVIFNGSASRKPAGFAEALLTFDNSRRTLQIDSDEVVIGRRIYRSGESEYLINRIPARLKDIKDLFLGTGAGTSAYSIIEQGRVDQLLQASNTARRTVFEEAAGISRFRVRKVDAERKLERVQQNLLRLTDIVKEVETQLNSTRNQASRAAKFREYSQELKALRVGSAADDHREFIARLEQYEIRKQELEATSQQLAAQAQECEAAQRAFESTLVTAEDALRQAERNESEHRELVARHEATLRHQVQRLNELDAEYERLDQQQKELAERVLVVSNELEQADADLTVFSNEAESRQARIQEALSEAQATAIELAMVREQREAAQKAMLALARQLSVAGTRYAGLRAQREQLEQSCSQAQNQFDAVRQQCDQARDALESAKQLVEQATAAQSALKSRQQQLVTRKGALLAESSESLQSISTLKEQRASLIARRTLLEEFERRQDGVGVGVREILALATQSRGEPWKHVKGHVIDLVECDIENAALVEVALGSRGQLLVLDDSEPILAALRSNGFRISGRVGFVVMPEHAGVPGSTESTTRLESLTERSALDLSSYSGVVCRADSLVRTPETLPGLAAHLLADTWIVRTVEVATALLHATTGRCRFVTLQGELIEANGTLFVGSLAGESTTISRKSELRNIRSDLVRIDRQIAMAEQSLLRHKAELQTIDQDEAQLQFDVDLGAHHLAEQRSACSAAELELQRHQQQQERLSKDFTHYSTQLAELLPTVNESEAELAQAEQQQEELQTEFNRLEQELVERENAFRETQERQSTLANEATHFSDRLQQLRVSRSRLDQERFQRDLQHEEADRRFQVLASRREQIEAEAQKTEAALAELRVTHEQLTSVTTAARQEHERARGLRGELGERDLNLRHQLRSAQESLHQTQMHEAELRHQLASVADRLRDEFQMEIADALNEGVSARAVMRAQREQENAAVAEEGAVPAEISLEVERSQIEEHINRLRRKIKQLGHVNADSLKELDDLESRFARLSGQLQDLVEAKNSLDEIIRRINTESRRIFVDCFSEIRKNFQELFRKLFGGGEGDVVLENPDDVLECGIDVVARPPGKELRNLTLLSGGEKTMAAVALLLAIFKSKPSPFCILDEVDAALDEGNVNRYLNVIREFQEWTQFIVVTHNKRTMSGAEVLYGVTMEEAGISKRMSVRFEDVSEDGNFKTAA